MAVVRQRSTGNWECIIRRKALLAKPHYSTHDTEREARLYAANMEAILDTGVIPPDMIVATPSRLPIGMWLEEYAKKANPSELDKSLIATICADIGNMPLDAVNTRTLMDWVKAMKRRKLAPGSIRKRMGAVARALDYAVHEEIMETNPARHIPKRYSLYSEVDGKPVKDVERDRRLEPGEERRLFEVMAGRPDWILLVTLALETAMRLREMFTLTMEQIDLARRTVFLDKTKNGDKRQVPLSSIAVAAISEVKSDGFLFGFWDGKADLANTTNKLSKQFARIAKNAGCENLHFHDLRHEATSRFYERTKLSDLQIAKITGHKDLKMLRRYANLRGSDLADQLW